MRQSTSPDAHLNPEGLRRSGAVVALLAAGCLASCLTGCRAGPDAPPKSDPPPTDAMVATSGSSVTSAAPVARWWEQLNDPTLNALMARAEASNQSLAASLASVRAAYAALGATESELWPQIGAGAQYTRTKTNIAQLAAAGVRVEPYNMYAYGVGLSSWEIDLWGGVARQIEAAKATAEAQADMMRDALVSVRGQVGASYIQLRTLQAQRAVLGENAKAFRQTLDTVQSRYNAGANTGLDVARAQAQVDAVDAQIPQVDAAIAKSFSTIAVLCGANPSEMQAMLAKPAAIPSTPEVVGVGLPADLIERRPDVRKAKQQLVAATAAIGIAEASRLPNLSISGNFYIASTDLAGLGQLADHAYSFGPSLSLPIFTGGKIDSTVRQQKAQAEGALAMYRNAVITAVGDLSASVSDFVQAHESQVRADAALASASKALVLAQQQYDAGVTDITTLLDVQRSKLDAENSAAEAHGALSQGYVALGRAIGGGWDDTDEQKAIRQAQAADKNEDRTEQKQETKP